VDEFTARRLRRTLGGPVPTIRHAHPSDYGRVIQHVNAWWDGREMAPILPQLFFVHFESTSFVAEDGDGKLVGFLCGFLSQTEPDAAYVHFIGVDPALRGAGVGRALYEAFFSAALAHGRRVVRAVTSPDNAPSLAFHRSLAFEIERTVRDYDGPGEDRALLVRRIA
jgi:ribosomal protein S18 acetylase RimI-like enzyme